MNRSGPHTLPTGATAGRWVLVGLAAVGLVSGCGETKEEQAGEDTPAATAAAEPAALPRTELSVSTTDGRTVRSRQLTVRGVATPGARVEVEGESATATGTGRWNVEVALDLGPNRFEVQATAEGHEPATEDVNISRRRSSAELAAWRASRKAIAERKARERAERAVKRAAEQAKPSYDNPSMAAINAAMTDYLSAVINDPATADPGVAASNVQDLAAGASPACARELNATATALLDSSGGPDAIRSRVLDASFEATMACE